MRTAALLLLAACNLKVDVQPTRDPTKPGLEEELDDIVDDRPPPPQPHFTQVVQADAPPPPISGGTLAILQNGTTAIAADPDRERVYVVDLVLRKVIADIEAKGEPGRVVEDSAHRVHVVLRTGGAVLTLAAPWTVTTKRSVCPLPRGIAAKGDDLYVACAGGELVTLPAAGGGATRTVQLDNDLRDVVVVGDQLFVSRLRTADVLVLEADGTRSEVLRPAHYSAGGKGFVPSAAMRLVATSSGSALLLHQRGLDQQIGTKQDGGYGGPDPCFDPIVQTAITELAAGASAFAAPPIARAVVPIDLAVSPTRMAVVAPGNAFIDGHATIFVFEGQSPERMSPPPLHACTNPTQTNSIEGQPIAAAFAKDGTLWVQSREPATLIDLGTTRGSGAGLASIVLSTLSRKDTGHEVFHANAGGNVACASCHLEGGDDSLTWSFEGIGARRTQSLRGGIAGSEPFHWDGDQADFTALTREVFERRMSGPALSPAAIAATARWVNAIPQLPSPAAKDAAAAARGQQLFEQGAQCTSCHNGDRLTNNATVYVGTGGSLQVPSLRGLVWRAPYMHTGRAFTLQQRFDAIGGGDYHGKTSQLNAGEIADLVVYLETL